MVASKISRRNFLLGSAAVAAVGVKMAADPGRTMVWFTERVMEWTEEQDWTVVRWDEKYGLVFEQQHVVRMTYVGPPVSFARLAA